MVPIGPRCAPRRRQELRSTSVAPNVATVRVFRHPPLLLWTVVFVVLGVIVLLAVGSNKTVAAQPIGVAADGPAVFALRQRMPEMLSLAGHGGGGLDQWAQGTAQIARAAAEGRRHSGAEPNDALVDQYEELAANAERLAATDPADTDTVGQLVSAVAYDANELTTLVHLGALGPQLTGSLPPMPIEDPELDLGGERPVVPTTVAPARPSPVEPGAPLTDIPSTGAPEQPERTLTTLPPRPYALGLTSPVRKANQ